MLSKFGEFLRNTRELNHLSIEEISNITKIDKKFIEEMESGNFEFQPMVYIKAFLKSYAKAVNLDPDDVLKKFEMAKNNKDADSFTKTSNSVSNTNDNSVTIVQKVSSNNTSDEKPILTFSDDTYQQSNQSMPEYSTNDINHDGYSKIGYQKTSKIYIISAFILLVVLVIAAYIYKNNGSLWGNEEIVVNNNPTLYEEKQQPDTAKVSIGDNSQIPNDSLSLTISYSKISWTRIIPDENKKATFEKIGQEGQSFTIKAKNKFFVWVGNASAINLQFNGNNVEFDNKRIASIRLEIDSTGKATEIIPPKKVESTTITGINENNETR